MAVKEPSTNLAVGIHRLVFFCAVFRFRLNPPIPENLSFEGLTLSFLRILLVFLPSHDQNTLDFDKNTLSFGQNTLSFVKNLSFQRT